ncbi:MAG: hypothetical protein ACKVP2_09375 [Burkholderiales bacterium]
MMHPDAGGIGGACRNGRFAVHLAIRTVLAWMTVCLTIYFAQRPLTVLLLPFYETVIRLLQQDFTGSLQWMEYKGQSAIQMTAFLLHAVPLTDQLALRPFVSLPPITVSVDHALVPLVLLMAGIISWPFSGNREAVMRMTLAIAVTPPILALSTPVLLVGGQQLAFFEAALRRGAALQESGMVTLMVFMESGGRWLLPLTAAVACVLVSRRLCENPLNKAPVKDRPTASGASDLAFPPV